MTLTVLPVIIAMLLVSFINVSTPDKPVVPKWLHITGFVFIICSGFIWVAAGFGTLPSFVELTPSDGWFYFASGMFVSRIIGQSRGMVIAKSSSK